MCVGLLQRIDINGKDLIIDPEGDSPRKVCVLFEETFYNDNDESYRVVCIDAPIAGELVADQYDVVLDSLAKCDEFLWSMGRNGSRLKSKVQVLCKGFVDQR